MKLPYSWIKESLPSDLSAEKLAEVLTLLGLEVDSIDVPELPFTGVVVAKVLSTERHPNADHLVVAQVFDGCSVTQVVCGAPNCRKDLVTAFAKVGASLVSEGKRFKIKRSKLRGVESNGMLCAAEELGFAQSSGILELPSDSPLGEDLSKLFSDAIFSITLTPNLGHCASLQGVLRELSASLEIPYSLPEIALKESKEKIDSLLTVNCVEETKCLRYACRIIKNVKVAPSPEWLQERLLKCGLRAINNVVDVTNYVLWELGHPLHAFDYAKIEGSQIVIKNAEERRPFTTLDGLERELDSDALLICDGQKPIAIAGIMGGECAEVGEETQHIVLESAYFAPSSIRKTSKKLGLSTEASKRFERSTDPNSVLIALNRAAALISEIAGGDIVQGVIDCRLSDFPKREVVCRASRVESVLGLSLSIAEIKNIFDRLGFSYRYEDSFYVEIPTYRADICAEIDLIEEIARIYGYTNLPKTPAPYRTSFLPHSPMFLFEKRARESLLRQGLQEVISCDLIGPSLLKPFEAKDHIHILNPTSIEQSILRQSLLPGMLQIAKHNIDRKNPHLTLFEVGRAHFREQDSFKEQSILSILLTGSSSTRHWKGSAEAFDFYDLKGVIENFFLAMAVKAPLFERSTLCSFHPGRQANLFIDAVDVGAIGEIHPDILHHFGISQPILFAECNLHDLFRLRKDAVKMVDLPTFPGSERDWTLSLSKEIPCERIFQLIRTFAPSLLEEVFLLDLYQNAALGEGVKNATFRFFYRDRSRTVQQQEVDLKHFSLIEKVAASLEDVIL